MTGIENQAEVLQDFTASGKEIDWRARKMANTYLAQAYESIDQHKAGRLRSCSTLLVYGVARDPVTQEMQRKLRTANFCRVRLCPICQWRKSMKLYGQMRKVLDYLEPQGYAYLFLTLTTPNVTADKLSGTLDDLANAFHLFMQYKEVKQIVKGWYRGTEVTHNLDRSSKDFDTFHPHFHIIIAVNKSYFTSRYYLSQARITELWKRALGLSVTPIVDIRKIYGSTAESVCEATKYAAKAKDFIVLDDWDLTVETVRTLDSALDSRRLIGFGGVMREARKKLKLQDIETGNLVELEDQDVDTASDEYFESYAWHTGFSQYIRTE